MEQVCCTISLLAFLTNNSSQSLDIIVKTLLKVGSKSSTFIREDVEKAINEMIRGVSPNKCVSSLLSGGMGHNNKDVRRLLSQCLYSIVEYHGADRVLKQLSRDVLEKFLSATVTLLTDADVGARYYIVLYN